MTNSKLIAVRFLYIHLIQNIVWNHETVWRLAHRVNYFNQTFSKPFCHNKLKVIVVKLNAFCNNDPYLTFLSVISTLLLYAHVHFSSFLWPSSPPLPPLSTPPGLLGVPGSCSRWHVFADNRLANTDRPLLFCPNIADCFHIRGESLETVRHLLFMGAINYSPWYELQSRKASAGDRGTLW